MSASKAAQVLVTIAVTNDPHPFGFGVMPGLDKLVLNAERRDVILSLASKTMMRLRGYGAVVRKDELNNLLGSNESGYFTDDVEAALFVRMEDYFRKLLREELRPNETDVRFPWFKFRTS